MTAAEHGLARRMWHDERGRLCGCGVTNPRRDRIRQIVATAGEQPARWRRCQAMVSAPASRPDPVSSLRNATIASSAAWLVRCGLVCGRRDRGPNAASPSARYRAVSFCTHRRDTP